MRAVIVTAAVALALAGCGEPKLVADSADLFQTSYEKAVKELRAESLPAFESALKDLVLIQIGMYEPLRDSAATDMDGFPSGSRGLGALAADTAIETAWEKDKSKMVVANAAPLINGLTPTQVIGVAASERKRANEKALGIYSAQLSKTEMALAAANAELEREKAELSSQTKTLESIILERPRFWYYKKEYGSPDPVISFTITNGSDIPLKRIFVKGVLQTPGRAVPWVSDDFNYSFPGGLEPKEKKNLNLEPNMFGEWGKVPRDAVDGAVLTLHLEKVEDASGTEIGKTSSVDDARRRADRLQEGVDLLRQKIEGLQRANGA